MSKGKRYNEEEKLNVKKVFAVIIAIIVLVMVGFMLKNILSKAKNTKPVEAVNYYALYQDAKWGIIGTNGETVINPMYQEIPIVIDKSKDVFLFTYDINEEDGTYKTKAVNKNNEQLFTNYDKVEALENYDSAENVWYEKNVLKVEKDGKWGLIDTDGKEISEIIYDNIKTLKGIQNSIIVEKEGKYGLLNCNGVKILDTNYSEILNFGDDYINGYITKNQDGKFGIVNVSGEQVLENNYEEIYNIYSDKYFVIGENGNQQLINKDKEKVLTENFDEIKQITSTGVIYVKDGKYGFMDFEGNIIIEANYDVLNEINTGIFLTQKDGKAGLIDKDKNEKVAFNFKNIYYNQKAGIYIAENEDLTQTLIDSNFQTKVVGILSELNTDKGYMKIKVDDSYKYYNFRFEEKNIKDIYVNNKIFVSKKDGKYGFIDTKENVVVDYIYDDATELNEYGFAAIKKDGLWGAIDKEGNIVIDPKYNLDENLKIDFIGKWHLGVDLNMNYYCDK